MWYDMKMEMRKMQIIYNTEKLQQILHGLSVLTGVSIAFLNKDFERVCGSVKENDFCETILSLESFKEKCFESDNTILTRCSKSRRFECHFCHAGLYDAALPVIINGSIAGYLIMGRVRSADSPKECIVSGNKDLKKLYAELPFFSKSQLESLKTLLPNILFSDAINVELDELGEKIAEHIKANLSSDLSVDSICKKFFISKNHLYKYFNVSYGTTVNEYITRLRMEKAKRLLCETKETVYSIGEKVGIDNYTYFCRLFKKRENMTPVQFRTTSNKCKK